MITLSTCNYLQKPTKPVKIPSAPAVLIQPIENFTTLPFICATQQNYVMGGCSCQTTYQSTQPQVVYSIQGSGYLFGSLIRLLLNEIESLELAYTQPIVTVPVRPKSTVNSVITPPAGDTTHCSVYVNLVPLTTTYVYIKLGTASNPTTQVKVVGNWENLNYGCLSCPASSSITVTSSSSTSSTTFQGQNFISSP